MTPQSKSVSALLPLVPVIAALLFAACAASAPAAGGNVKENEALIRKLNADWIAAEASNNVESALAFIWDDATMQPPNAAEIQGHAAIRAAYESVRFVSLTSDSTKVSISAAGDLAAIWGPLKVVIQTPAGPLTLDQKFVAVWQKRGATWKVIENSWSDNLPAALQPGPTLPTGTPTPSSSQEIDAQVWSVFVATVATDDIVRMGNLYVPNAVLVTPRETAPIKATLERWGRDMVTAKAKGNRATVEFRFSRRQDGATTAFEAGIFKYTVIDKSGAASPKFYPFEMLLARTEGTWRVLMERQFAEVTQDAWDKLPK